MSDPWKKNDRLYGQNFKKLQASHLKSKSLFEDPHFPPNSYSLSYSGKVEGDSARLGKGKKKVSTEAAEIKWVRASSLFPNALLVVDGSSKDDVNQGRLGNCWFLCALVGAATIPHIFKKLVPRDQGFDKKQYAGIFHFKFWQYGSWVDVIVDDFLPTINGELLFVQSDDRGEMWPCLVEKAYAKLHGSYDHLSGGMPVEALVDFTGGFPEGYTGPGYGALEGLSTDLYAEMKRALEERPGVLITTCSLIHKYRNLGIAGGHAYTVMGLLGSDEKWSKLPRLVKIRNPWGNSFEWRGRWSDQHIMSNSSLSMEEKQKLVTGVGEWWMPYDDFTKCFTHLTICHPEPEPKERQAKVDWKENSFEGRWEKESGGSGADEGGLTGLLNNPQFRFSLTKDATHEVSIALMQKGRRQLRDELGYDTFLPIGLTLFKLNKRIRRPMKISVPGLLVGGMAYSYYRTVTLQTKLPKGHYALVAATYYPGMEGEFFLRIAAPEKSNLSVRKL